MRKIERLSDRDLWFPQLFVISPSWHLHARLIWREIFWTYKTILVLFSLSLFLGWPPRACQSPVLTSQLECPLNVLSELSMAMKEFFLKAMPKCLPGGPHRWKSPGLHGNSSSVPSQPSTNLLHSAALFALLLSGPLKAFPSPSFKWCNCGWLKPHFYMCQNQFSP